MSSTLTAGERQALQLLVESGGSVLETRIPDTSERDVFGAVIPGHPVYRRLAKRGFCFYSEEEPMNLPGDPLDGFLFTPEVYITDEGRGALRFSPV